MQFNSSIKIYLISYFDVDINCHVGHFQGKSIQKLFTGKKNKGTGLSVFQLIRPLKPLTNGGKSSHWCKSIKIQYCYKKNIPHIDLHHRPQRPNKTKNSNGWQIHCISVIMPNSDVVYIMRSSGRTVCKFKVNGIHVLHLENESEGPGNAEKRAIQRSATTRKQPACYCAGSPRFKAWSWDFWGCPVELGTAGVCSGSFRF